MVYQLLHWYLFSCEGRPDGDKHGALLRRAVTMGLSQQRVTRADIEAAQRACGLAVGGTTVLVAVSYLGEMTRGEFIGPEDDMESSGITVVDRG